MRLSVKALSLASGILWGGCILVTGLINVAAPGYGQAFLVGMSSIYPGYHVTHTVGAAVTGGCYGLVDGVVGGAIFAWLYNLIAGRGAAASPAAAR